MIDKAALETFIARRLEGTDCFPVEVKVSDSNDITVEIDSMTGVDVDRCIELTRAIEEAFPRDLEDYSLEVGSAGLTAPFKVPAQYEKNLGRKVDVVTKEGKKLTGTLVEVGPEKFTVSVTVKVRPEGAKRPVEQEERREFAYSDAKSVRYHLEF